MMPNHLFHLPLMLPNVLNGGRTQLYLPLATSHIWYLSNILWKQSHMKAFCKIWSRGTFKNIWVSSLDESNPSYCWLITFMFLLGWFSGCSCIHWLRCLRSSQTPWVSIIIIIENGQHNKNHKSDSLIVTQFYKTVNVGTFFKLVLCLYHEPQ